MAKSKNYVFKGKGYWARVYEGNHDEYCGKEFCKITVALDDSSWSKFNQSGLSLKVKPVEQDGEGGITFRRDLHGKSGVGTNGKPWKIGGGPPRVVDEDGNSMTDLIGNGSDVEVIVEVYTVANGPMKGKKGHRLEAVKVTKLIPYDTFEEDEDEVEEEPEVQEEEAPKKSSKKGLPF